ncbi:uncharacterized protein LOC110747462 [Prunus avium]|uniref:Uncharacterized protein LOC110747462 n=1 Tax=Prunus avium TaxID=42229 RepID=A0A6P5RK12_PRUAV|nr:uncharacterized protein LOC110747462 [Prunus avium]
MPSKSVQTALFRGAIEFHSNPHPCFLLPLAAPPFTITHHHPTTVGRRTSPERTSDISAAQPDPFPVACRHESPERTRKSRQFWQNFVGSVRRHPATKSDELGTRAPGDPQEGPSKGLASSEYLQ